MIICDGRGSKKTFNSLYSDEVVKHLLLCVNCFDYNNLGLFLILIRMSNTYKNRRQDQTVALDNAAITRISSTNVLNITVTHVFGLKAMFYLSVLVLLFFPC